MGAAQMYTTFLNRHEAFQEIKQVFQPGANFSNVQTAFLFCGIAASHQSRDWKYNGG